MAQQQTHTHGHARKTLLWLNKLFLPNKFSNLYVENGVKVFPSHSACLSIVRNNIQYDEYIRGHASICIPNRTCIICQFHFFHCFFFTITSFVWISSSYATEWNAQEYKPTRKNKITYTMFVKPMKAGRSVKKESVGTFRKLQPKKQHYFIIYQSFIIRSFACFPKSREKKMNLRSAQQQQHQKNTEK